MVFEFENWHQDRKNTKFRIYIKLILSNLRNNNKIWIMMDSSIFKKLFFLYLNESSPVCFYLKKTKLNIKQFYLTGLNFGVELKIRKRKLINFKK